MEQRISLITLGVSDMKAAGEFYEALGWKRVETPDNLIVFDLIGQSLGLYPKAKLAQDLGIESETLSGSGSITLSQNLRSKDEVDALMERARSIGASILKEAQEVFWGGYHGYFVDLDAHIWEVAFNPFSPLGPNNEFCWNGFGGS